MDEYYNPTDTLVVIHEGTSSFYSKIIGSHGYTGHEIIAGLGVYNANARLYDPVTGRFMSPDPLVQDPANTQNFNRYTYCLNNPLKYTDESGEIVWELALLAGHIAGMINLMSNTEAINNSGDKWALLKYYGVGFLSGFLGSATASAAPGFWGGGFSSASSGFLSSFISGYGNAIISGANNPFASGVITGFSGAASGFVIGGVNGGINAIQHGGKFWTEIGTINDYVFEPALEYINDGNIEYSNDSAIRFSNKYFKKKGYGVRKIYANGTLPKGYSRDDFGHVRNSKGQRVGGASIYRGRSGTDIYLFGDSFDSPEQLYLVMGHEYGHAYLNSLGYSAGAYTDMQEAAINQWMHEQAVAFNYKTNNFPEQKMNSLYEVRFLKLIKSQFPLIKKL